LGGYQLVLKTKHFERKGVARNFDEMFFSKAENETKGSSCGLMVSGGRRSRI
jgi:hypothetical protein